jgi:hypothetical protein
MGKKRLKKKKKKKKEKRINIFQDRAQKPGPSTHLHLFYGRLWRKMNETVISCPRKAQIEI